MTSPLPSLFVPHGAPTFALAPGAAGAALKAQADALPRPRAIIIVSPHWQTESTTVGTADRLETIHDFTGFPDALYAIRYPASGCREGAEVVAAALAAAGLDVRLDRQRGLDHGAWVPLRLMYPDADVPVIPLSLPHTATPANAFRLGLALAPLTQRGFLVIGSGSLTHNLRDFQRASHTDGADVGYVHTFADWFASHLAAGDVDALLDYRRRAPEAARAHPSEEHLLPLFVALGAGGPAANAHRFHSGIDDYVIAMDAYAFRPSQGEQQ